MHLYSFEEWTYKFQLYVNHIHVSLGTLVPNSRDWQGKLASERLGK